MRFREGFGKMDGFRRFRAYWIENFKIAVEWHEMIILIALILVLVLSIGLQWIIDSQAVERALKIITTCSAFGCFLIAVLWLPFKRHEKDEKDRAFSVKVLEGNVQSAKETKYLEESIIIENLGQFRR